jgi:gliding motility-associated lipoprotein GldH
MYYNLSLPKRFSLKNLFLLLLMFGSLPFAACDLPSGVFEKNVAIPGQQWASDFKPRIDFTIGGQDTGYLYNVYLVLRHSDAYNYNNIWIRGTVLEPGENGPKSQQYDLPLATNDKGWLGSGMDDIYEQRVLIQGETKFEKAGRYSFTIEQIMREDPLKHILDVGVRIEKVK